MLKGINSVASPDLLQVLCSMGHGHTIAVVDANYPVNEGEAKIVRMDGVLATDILDAILSLTPVETAHEDATCRMIVDGDPGKTLPILEEFQRIIAKHEAAAPETLKITPNDFKARAAASFAIVVSGDRRVYGNILVKKGVVSN